VFCVVLNEFTNHGCQEAMRHRHLPQWWHPLASSEARDVIHQAMRPVLHHRIHMVIKIASNFTTFFVVVDSVVVDNLR
jgi:hypothetical protein